MCSSDLVIIEKGGAYIYVVRKNQTVEKRFIELGPEQDNQVVVERGLAPGEEIVIEGYHKLSPGMKVQITNQPAKAVNAQPAAATSQTK